MSGKTQVRLAVAPSVRREIAPPRAAAHRHGRADLARWPRRRARRTGVSALRAADRPSTRAGGASRTRDAELE